MAKTLLYIFAVISLVVSFYWGITNNQYLEPWTAFIGAVLFFIGLFVQNDQPKPSNTQRNLFSFLNKSSIKRSGKGNTQTNFFGFGNRQEIEGSDERTEDRNA
jgi:hypothetical protein